MVSGRVVKTFMICGCASISKSINNPSDLPIQLRCCSFKEGVKSTWSRPSNKRWAYDEILKLHCIISFCSTG